MKMTMTNGIGLEVCTKEAYTTILVRNINEEPSDLTEAWNKLVSLKFDVLVWILLQNMIPIMHNLIKRGVLNESLSTYSLGCKNVD